MVHIIPYAARRLPLLALLIASASPSAWGVEQSYQTRSYETAALGAPLSAELSAGNPAATQTIELNTNTTVLGANLNPLNARVESPDTLLPGGGGPDSITIGGTSYTTFYSFGRAVLGKSFSITSGGINNVKIGLAPTEVRVPFVVYPVGPLLLDVGGGARFQANVSATLAPILAIPLQDSGLTVQLQAMAMAAGFVEAYASLFFLRAGVGGQVDLVNGQVDVNGQLLFNQLNHPAVLVNGFAQFFNGEIYAFADIFGFLTMGWLRLINQKIYSWKGLCYTFGAAQCPAN